MAATPPLIWANGQPMRAEPAVLKGEVAGPTTAGIRSILRQGIRGRLTPPYLARLLLDAEAGDPIAYLELAEDMEEKDLHYLSVLGTRKRAVTKLPISVEPAGDSDDEKADAQFVSDWLKRDTLRSELFDVLDGLGKGYSATEIVWDFSDALWLPAELKLRDPRWFQFDRQTGETLGLRGTGADPDPLPPAKFIVHKHPAKSGLPIRGGLARAVAWGYMFKNYATSDWVSFLETYGMPLRLGRYDNGETETNIAKLMAAIADLGSDAAAVFPKSMEIEFPDTKAGTAPNELWKSLAEYVDLQVSKAVLGQTSSSDATAGGLGSGQADAHEQVREDIRDDDIGLLAATLNRDLIRPMVMLNRGPRRRYPRLKIGHPDRVDVAAMINSVRTLVPLGLQVGMEDIRERAGLPAPAAGVQLLAPPVGGQEGAAGDEGGLDTQRTPTRPLNPSYIAPAGQRRTTAAAIPVEPTNRDAIDDATEEALADWEELIGPLLQPIDQLLSSASSLAEARAMLTGAIEQMDADAFTELLARGGFAARIAGDLDARGDDRGN